VNEQQTNISPLINHLFRYETGKMIAVLTRLFGIHNLELAEDVVQDAFARAAEVWKFNGLPDNPSAWLMQTAKNKAIDIIRRERYKKEFAKDLTYQLQSEYTTSQTIQQVFLEHEIQDSQLRMIFTCCHPQLTDEDQIALTLKTISGFSIQEIANALLSSVAAINKRLFRAKQYIRENNIQFEIPLQKGLQARLENVLRALYLIFNEGYNSSHREKLIRKDLCEEAMRLCMLLTEHSYTKQPSCFALLSLICFQSSRLDARINEEGEIILLNEQNRSKWNWALIERGFYFLDEAAFGEEVSEYHIEAAIASFYSAAKTYEEIDWKNILAFYDALMKKNFSPVIQLNRAIVLSKIDSPQKAIDAVMQISKIESFLETHYLFNATLGELYAANSDKTKALQFYHKAHALTTSESEKNCWKRR
jgi:RNA polymerase sigma factor (sigma-70 family)